MDSDIEQSLTLHSKKMDKMLFHLMGEAFRRCYFRTRR